MKALGFEPTPQQWDIASSSGVSGSVIISAINDELQRIIDTSQQVGRQEIITDLYNLTIELAAKSPETAYKLQAIIEQLEKRYT